MCSAFRVCSQQMLVLSVVLVQVRLLLGPRQLPGLTVEHDGPQLGLQLLRTHAEGSSFVPCNACVSDSCGRHHDGEVCAMPRDHRSCVRSCSGPFDVLTGV